MVIIFTLNIFPVVVRFMLNPLICLFFPASQLTKSDSKSASRGKESLRLWLRLLSCESIIEQRVRGRFRKHFAVTLPQFDVLSELERAKTPLTMSQLSKELMVSNGNVTGVIDRLSKTELVRRVRSQEDARQKNQQGDGSDGDRRERDVLNGSGGHVSSSASRRRSSTHWRSCSSSAGARSPWSMSWCSSG